MIHEDKLSADVSVEKKLLPLQYADLHTLAGNCINVKHMHGSRATAEI